MAATLQLARNTHVYMKVGTNYWKLPVLDGFSFSQSTATQELALNEMQDTTGNSNRGRTMFTNALEPAEWSFSMYARPTLSGGTTHSAVEEALWALFLELLHILQVQVYGREHQTLPFQEPQSAERRVPIW